MTSDVRRFLAFVVGTFAVVGLSFGLAGHVVVWWARTQFLSAASGNSPDAFGPVFVALVFFQTTATIFLVGTGLSALLGALAGSRFRSAREAVVVAGAGGTAGYYVMTLVALVVLSLAGGRGTEQTYGLGQALAPFALSGVPAAVAGTVGGLLGSRLAR